MCYMSSNIINSAEHAVFVAKDLINTGTYKLGTGDCDTPPGAPSDCAGFAINKCYNIRRHRPGFNKGSWASVEDDINCNSAIEDADHKQELFERVTDVPKPGDLLTYPTFRLHNHAQPFIGHVAIVIGVPAEWAWGYSKWGELTVVQCCGPDGRKPGIVKSNAGHWDAHDATWPKPEHRSVLLRVKQEKQNAN